MRYVLKLEKIAEQKPWVAVIHGPDEKYGFSREFQTAQVDYSESNSVGSRGIFYYFSLRPGIYEASSRYSFKKQERYFLRVLSDSEAERMTMAEVLGHFANLEKQRLDALTKIVEDEAEAVAELEEELCH